LDHWSPRLQADERDQEAFQVGLAAEDDGDRYSLRCPRDGGCCDRLWRLRKTRARRIAVQHLEVAERCAGCPCYIMLPSFTAMNQ